MCSLPPVLCMQGFIHQLDIEAWPFSFLGLVLLGSFFLFQSVMSNIWWVKVLVSQFQEHLHKVSFDTLENSLYFRHMPCIFFFFFFFGWTQSSMSQLLANQKQLVHIFLYSKAGFHPAVYAPGVLVEQTREFRTLWTDTILSK